MAFFSLPRHRVFFDCEADSEGFIAAKEAMVRNFARNALSDETESELSEGGG